MEWFSPLNFSSLNLGIRIIYLFHCEKISFLGLSLFSNSFHILGSAFNNVEVSVCSGFFDCTVCGNILVSSDELPSVVTINCNNVIGDEVRIRKTDESRNNDSSSLELCEVRASGPGRINFSKIKFE